MLKVNLPQEINKEKIGKRTKKNELVYLSIPASEVEVKIEKETSDFILLKGKDAVSYTIVFDEKDIPARAKYVLLSKTIKGKDIKLDSFKNAKWLKHPHLKPLPTPTKIIDSWKGAFNFKEEDTDKKLLGLRLPQIGAIHSIIGHLTNAKDIANIVLPTGTGKTETMLSVLAVHGCQKLLITVPSDSLRQQLAGKFQDFGLLKMKDDEGNSILNQSALNPIVGILNTGFDSVEELTDFFGKCNVVISTMNLVSQALINQQQAIAKICSHLFVDEAHHSKAKKWNQFIRRFDKNKVIQFTATPYRNDAKLLDGKIIYNFTLKESQDQGYFKEIEFLPIREYDKKEADAKIAETAIKRLREDLADGHEHILMARCENIVRAEEIFKLYEEHTDLNPVMIHSKTLKKKEVKQNIRDKKHQVIVCVDMLGEGFDLPQLKVAALHDIRKSLPITLQFIGRFTRTTMDNSLGKASFIANMYQKNMNDTIGMLYLKESNWNSILPNLSSQATQEQVDLNKFLEGFNHLEESLIPYQEIKTAFSAVVYKNHTTSWHPVNFHKGIKGYENYQHKYFDINTEAQVIIVLLGKNKKVDWSTFGDIYNIEWNVVVVYWKTKDNLLFVNTSDKGLNPEAISKAIIGDKMTLVGDSNVFRVFDQIERVKLYNVGMRKGRGKNITFQSYYGRGVQDAISLVEEKSGIKNNLFGVGFQNGETTSIGCSRKGKIWSYSRGTIDLFIKWCNVVGSKLSNEDLNGEEILMKNTIRPELLSERPKVYPLSAEWHPKLYKESEDHARFVFATEEFDLSSCELNIINPSDTGNLKFSLDTDDETLEFEYKMSEKAIGTDIEYNYSILNSTGKNISVKFGSKTFDTITDFFQEYPPIFRFADGSWLHANSYIKFDQKILYFPKEKLIKRDWTGIDISKESEGFDIQNTTSIQYNFIEELKTKDYDIIYNDDNSGEIADIIAIKNKSDKIIVEFYHLKFALKGEVTGQIKNFYEVCGQAQKSIVWKHKDGDEFINHLIKREHTKNKKGQTRIRKGTFAELEKLLAIAKREKPIEYDMFIVQPGVSEEKISNEILHLLQVTANHIKIEAGIDLSVIISKS